MPDEDKSYAPIYSPDEMEYPPLKRKATEPAKVAFRKFRKCSLDPIWGHSWVHIIAVSAAVAITFLNAFSVFYGGFPFIFTKPFILVKPLELLMQASIASILLAFINNQARSSFIPFGCLFAPRNITAVAYLFSWQFWGCISHYSTFAAGLFAGFCIVLATVVGPAIYTATMPRLVEHTVANNRTNLQETPSVLFPMNITRRYEPTM